MKLLAWMLVFTVGTAVYGQEMLEERSGTPGLSLLKKAATFFSEGKYGTTIIELQEVESKLLSTPGHSKETLGLIAYWKGITFVRNQDFPEAITSFDEALRLGYNPEDLHYEYGQALFASEKLQEARIQFRESLKRGFKRGVSLYYIGFISKELGERKKAFTFFRAIEKLKGEEAEEVRQAAEMQIGDIYLEQVERHPDAFRAIENYVIPQYEKALKVNPDSNLAGTLQEKIVALQRKYDLVLFQLRNGRATLIPPYFMRLAAEYGSDSNVTFSPNETTVAKSRQSSLFGKMSAMGRYTFYYQDVASISPEMNISYTRYFNRVPEIYRNDNLVLSPSLRSAIEYTLWKKPASHLLDYEYTEIKRDVNAEQELAFNSRSHGIMLGEKVNFFSAGETVARVRYRVTDSYLDSSDSKTTSFSLEQVYGLSSNTLLFYFSYDRMKMTDESFDTNSMTFRADLIMSKVRDWFVPSFGIGQTITDPVNDRKNRGKETLFNPSVRLSRTFGKNWRGNLKYDFQDNKSKDDANFSYKKDLISFELEYVF